MWKRCLDANSELLSIANHVWDQNVNICWNEEPFPKDIEEILARGKYNENELTMKRLRVTKRRIHSKSRRIKPNLGGWFGWGG